MVFNTGAALLDAIVLAVVSKEPEGTYGYKITQEVRNVIELSEEVREKSFWPATEPSTENCEETIPVSKSISLL